MKREIISDKAQDYVSRMYAENEYPTTNSDIELDVETAFVDGAQWRINSVWHDMEKEVPQVYGEYENKIAPSIPCLVRGHLSTGYWYGVRYWNVYYEVWDDEEADDFECKADKIEEWAYLSDLLPDTRKEAEP